jgi:hypothetical protein
VVKKRSKSVHFQVTNKSSLERRLLLLKTILLQFNIYYLKDFFNFALEISSM